MGEVWKARDTRLNRIVAIKRLKGQHNQRFEAEARTIAALNHPHICQVYDVGEDYLVLEYIEGEILKGPLPLEDVLRYGIQIAEALDEAHRRGILHRDLKPGNIMVTGKKTAKLLDFGLAKQSHPERSSFNMSTETILETEPGMVLGTVAYMSPEQAQGWPLDARSDIFSLGLVLYEIVSGRRAFVRSTLLATLTAIAHEDAPPLDAPASVESIIRRCLARQPPERFQTAAELKAALEQASVSRAEPQPSIAVLPFANLSNDKENDYFSDGLSEEIINTLAHVPGLKVTARTSAFAFRGKEQDITKIAEALHVRTLLEGGVRRSGNRIRVTAQLVNAADGFQLWSQRYDGELTDIFAVQDEIASAIAAALKVELGTKPADRRDSRPGLPAYEAYLMGLHQLFKNTPEALTLSQEHLEQASVLDPTFAAPHVALAQCYILNAIHGLRPASDMMPLVRTEARKALDLDPSASFGHAMLGLVSGVYDHDWVEVERRFRSAMAIQPVAGLVRWPYANFCLAPFGRFREAAQQMEHWLEEDPLNVAARADLAFFLNHAGMCDQATGAARQALALDEAFWFAHYTMGEVYISRGMFAEALAPAETAHRLAPWNPRVTGLLAGVVARNGDASRANALVQQMSGTGPVGPLVYHLIRGDAEAARWYREAIEQHEPFAVIYARAPITSILRSSARWPELARMMNLAATSA